MRCVSLVGTHASLQQTIAAEGHVLSDELIIADLDRGDVKPCAAPSSDLFPTSLSGLALAAPPLGGLIRRLTPLVAAGDGKFDEGAVQAACLEFVADMLNLKNGLLLTPPNLLTPPTPRIAHVAPTPALHTWRL